MKKQNKAPDRENLYTLTICYLDESGIQRWTKWHRVELDKPAHRAAIERSLKAWYPGFHHANIYGGISRTLKGQIKFDK
jgi:hypothetical protein